MKKYFLLAATVLAVGTATTIQTETNPLGNLFVQSVKADEQTLTPTATYYILKDDNDDVFKNHKGGLDVTILEKTDKTPGLSYVKKSDVPYFQNLNQKGLDDYREWTGTEEEFKEAISKLSDKKVGDAEKTLSKEEQKPAEQKPAEKKEEKPAEKKPAEKKAEEKPAKVEEKKEEKRTIPETDLGVSAGFFALLGALGTTAIGKKIKD